MRPITKPSSQKGFSLIELMVAVAIVGILAAIAFPSYQSYVIRSNRADAQQALLQAAQAAERYYATVNPPTYVGFTVTPSRTPESGTAVYTLAATSAATTFSIIATPASGGVNSKNGCLQITSVGAKTWNGKRTTTGCGTTYDKTWTDRE